MNRYLLAAAILFSGCTLLCAQQGPKLEDDSTTDSASQATAAPQPGSLAASWRTEVLGWKDPLRIEAGSEVASVKELSRSVLVLGTVKGDVTNVAGDVAVLGTVEGNVSTVSGNVTVLGTVKGKASVVGGNLRIAGHVLSGTAVVGGKVENAPTEGVGDDEKSSVSETSNSVHSIGTSSAKGDFHFALNGGDFRFDLQDGSFTWNGFTDGLSEFVSAFWLSPFMLLWRGGMLVLWIALSGVLAALFPAPILRAQSEVRQAAVRSAALGLLWSMVFWVLLATCLILSLIIIGLPLLLILLAFELALLVFGRTVSFLLVGDWLAERLGQRQVSAFTAVFVGACALGLLGLIPIVGSAIWFGASLFGIGATLATRFGQVTPQPSNSATLPPPAAPSLG